MLLTLGLAMGLAACSDHDKAEPSKTGDTPPPYTIWLQFGNWPNTTQYVVGTDDLTEGSVSLEGNGAEVTAIADYGIIPHNGYYYYPSTSSDFGKMSKFEFKDNKLSVVKEVPFTYQGAISAMTWIDDNTLILFGTNGDGDKMLYSVVDATTLKITNGEIALPALPAGYPQYFLGNVESSGGKIYLAYANGATWPAPSQPGIRIAVIDYPAMSVSGVITSATADAPGATTCGCPPPAYRSPDVYMMFNASWMTDAASPSKILKIASGASQLDASFESNVGEALGGVATEGFWYVANGKAIVRYADPALEASGSLHYFKFAVVDLQAKAAYKLSDIPADKGS
jgi:hypothetical protein